MNIDRKNLSPIWATEIWILLAQSDIWSQLATKQALILIPVEAIWKGPKSYKVYFKHSRADKNDKKVLTTPPPIKKQWVNENF
jgi:hypothetical protein